MAKQKLIGGSFAPPIDEKKLKAYEAIAKGAETRVREQMTDLITMVRRFFETPQSELRGTKNAVGVMVVPLEQKEIDRIWDVVPYPDECDAIGRVFDTIPPGDVRNAAFHLLWYARELAADREPTTNDKLK